MTWDACDGTLDVAFERAGSGKTRLVRGHCTFPLHFTVPLYLDSSRPGMAFLYTQNAAGGICGGDRLWIRVSASDHTQLHLTTTAETKLHRSDGLTASETIEVELGRNAYCEFMPEPLIPFAGSIFDQAFRAEMHESATLVMGETIFPGRLGREECFAYERLRLRLEVSCEQQPLCADITCLTPPAMHPQRRGVLGKFRFLAALYAITPGRPTERLHSRIEQSIAGLNNVFAGGGKLPFNSGLFVKILADSPLAIRSATLVIFNTIRCELLGAPAPAVRK